MSTVTITARQLLNEIDKLAFGDRQRLLARYARTGDSLGELLADLHGQIANRAFTRTLAIQLAVVAREADYVVSCLSAPESPVVRRAIAAAVRLGVPPAVLVERLPTLPAALRRALYQTVRRRRATALADALFPVARKRFGEYEAAALLPACAADTVAAGLPELSYAITSWGLLGSQHPGVLLDHLEAELDRTPRRNWSMVLSEVGTGIAAAALSEPGRVLDLLAKTAPHASLPSTLHRTIGALARHDPEKLLAILLDPRRDGHIPGGRKLWRALLGASDADLVKLGRGLKAMHPTVFIRFLRTVPPARRTAIYAGVVGDRDLPSSGIAAGVLDVLPAETRAAEARRLLAFRSVADHPVLRLAVTARLPWPEAKQPLLAATRRSTADDRAAGYTELTRAGALSRDPEVFGEVLGALGRLNNDQDPVRLSGLCGVADAPPWLFQPSHMDMVRSLVTEATRARDCSWQTHQAIRRLGNRLIREGAVSRRPALVDAGLHALEQLSDNLSALDLYGLDRELPRGAEHKVFDTLRPRIDYEADRGRYGTALELAAGLGRRAWHLPELQAFVAKARGAKDDRTVRTAIGLWLAPPATKDQRLAEVLRADRSTITIHEVWNGVAWRRTDLLDEVFSKSLRGRFLKRGIRYLPTFRGCFHRWLPRQAARYADLLEKLATGRSVSVWERASAVRSLGQVPGTADRLRRYLDSEHVPVVEAALSALAWTDEPADVLADLARYADTDRARVAVYAITRCARFTAPGLLGERLRPLLTARKVTTRKEAARLLAEYRTPDAPAVLAEAWHAPGQHRDVARAIVSACRWFLDDEHAWQLLDLAVSGAYAPAGPGAPDEVAAAVLDLVPAHIARRHRTRYAALVNRVAAADDPNTARLGLAALRAWGRWDTGAAGLMARRVTDLSNTATWRATVPTLVGCCDTTEQHQPLLDAAAALLDASRADRDHTTVDRDLPARQRLAALAHAIRVESAAPTLRRAAAGLADLLTDHQPGDQTYRRLAVELAVGAVALAEEGADLDGLRRAAELADRPLWAWHAHHTLRTIAAQRVARLPQARLLHLATTLADDGPVPSGPLLALALAEAAGREAGWPAQWRDLVRGLREHQDTDVRLAALDTFTSPE